jgi:hypothetical protein
LLPAHFLIGARTELDHQYAAAKIACGPQTAPFDWCSRVGKEQRRRGDSLSPR